MHKVCQLTAYQAQHKVCQLTKRSEELNKERAKRVLQIKVLFKSASKYNHTSTTTSLINMKAISSFDHDDFKGELDEKV